MAQEPSRPYYDKAAAKRGQILALVMDAVSAIPKGVIKFGVATISRPSDESMRAVEKFKRG